MSSGVVRLPAGRAGARWLLAAGLWPWPLVAACEPSAPPGFNGCQPAQSAARRGGRAASSAAPDASGLVPGKPAVTTDGGKVIVAGLGAGKSPDFDLPAGSAQMVVTPCVASKVNPFVSLYDGNDTKVSLVVDPSYTLTNLTGGTYYLDVAANPERASDRSG